MRLTIIPSDKFISVDGAGLHASNDDFSWVAPNVRAVQWYGDRGEVEFNDGSPNEAISELGPFAEAIPKWEAAWIAYQAEIEAERERTRIQPWDLFIMQRNARLYETDWTQLPNGPLTAEQVQAWADYRQQLRDLPQHTTDPENPNWPVPPYVN